MFDNTKLDTVFKRQVKPGNPSCDAHYVVKDESGNDIAQVVFMGNELNIEVDNFPGQKQYYSTNLPVTSNIQFASELKRVGIDIL